MPKTAVNYYNLRKGLYLKNGARGHSLSRDQTRAVGTTYDHKFATKSVGILNAYGELANLTP